MFIAVFHKWIHNYTIKKVNKAMQLSLQNKMQVLQFYSWQEGDT